MSVVRRLCSHFSGTYRIRHGYGVYPIRNKREAKALYQFCRQELKDWDDERCHLNPRRYEIYAHYIRLYRWAFEDKGDDEYFTGKAVKKFGISAISVYDFARQYAGWFWS
jgi:hypothetical protein